MGTIYTDNPMHNGTQKESTANTSMSVTDKSSLLTKIEEQNRLFQDQNRIIQDQQSRMDNVENEVQAMRERFNTNPAESV